LWFFLIRKRKQKDVDVAKVEGETQQCQPVHELPVGARSERSELGSDALAELPANQHISPSELDTRYSR
jgi:hypothetical protein